MSSAIDNTKIIAAPDAILSASCNPATEVVTIIVGTDSKKPEAKCVTPVIVATDNTPTIAIVETPRTPFSIFEAPAGTNKDIVRDIKDIIAFANAKLAALGDATFSADKYEQSIHKLKELKKIITSFERLLSKSNSALLDEKAQLLKRLEEIQRATSIRSDTQAQTQTQETKSKSWADMTEAEERHQKSTPQSTSRRSTPSRDRNTPNMYHSESFDSSTPQSQGDFEEPKRRASGTRGGHRGIEGSAIFGGRGKSSSPFHTIGERSASERSYDREERDVQHETPRPKNRQGSRIPEISASPLMLKRRITPDDIESFAMIIKQDVKYGELVTFTSPQSGEITIGGIVNVITGSDGRSASRSGICEPLYYEGMCNCSTTALVLHGGKPLQLSMNDFVGILHKFINNFNGNHFHPSDVSKIHIDAVILRCIIYAIVQIIGFRRGQMTITINTFSDVTEPRNLLTAVDDYYKNGKEDIATSLARGLFIAIATHFVSS